MYSPSSIDPPTPNRVIEAGARRLQLLGNARPRTIAPAERGRTIRPNHRSRPCGEGGIGCVPYGVDREGEGVGDLNHIERHSRRKSQAEETMKNIYAILLDIRRSNRGAYRSLNRGREVFD